MRKNGVSVDRIQSGTTRWTSQSGYAENQIPSKINSNRLANDSQTAGGRQQRASSRGMSVVEGTFNGHAFQAPLEPDGMGSHWFSVSNTMLKAARAEVGDSVSVVLEPMAPWPEPKVPAGLAEALASDPQARRLWMDITPVARWDWIRWIGSTRNRDTRAIRVEKTLSKLRSGKRAACCFNRSQCTDPSMSRNGVLLEPTPAIGKAEGRQARSRRT